MVKRRFKQLLLPCLAVLLILPQWSGVVAAAEPTPATTDSMSPLTKGGSEVSNFYNTILQNGGDPWVYKHTDGYYYYTHTTGGNVTLWRSKTITGIDAGEKAVVWTPTKNTMYSSNIWAPELHYLDGKWYIYFAADNGTNANHRMYVLENASSNPLTGTWEFKGKITDSSDRWAIDGTVLDVKGELYFIWSGWEQTDGSFQNMYIAKMSNPWTISSERVLLSKPDYRWENTPGKINEGPQVNIRGNTINLVYSANGSWTDSYCLGLITADITADLLNPASWVKRDKPIFSSANGVYGPGHHSFTTSPDGSEDWILYHAARWQGSGWTRSIRTQKFTWNADGTPNLGAPVSPNTPIATPAGEPERKRYEAEDALLVKDPNGATTPIIRNESTASSGKKIANIVNGDDYAQFTVNVPEAGFYILSVRNANGSASGTSATQMLSVNDNSGIRLDVVHSGWNRWGISTAKVLLKAGDNTIRFSGETNLVEIASMDVFKLDAVPSILFDSPGYMLGLGESRSLPVYTVTGTASSLVGSGVSFTSSNEEVVAIDGAQVRGIKAGSSTITAAYDGMTTTTKVTVVAEPRSLQSLVFGGLSSFLTSGQTVQSQLTARYNTYEIQDVTADAAYSSSNPNVAKVTVTGQVYGDQPGNTIITAAYGGKAATFNLTVVHDPSLAPKVSTTIKAISGVASKYPSVVDVVYKAADGTDTTGKADVSWKLDGIDLTTPGTVYVPVQLTLNGNVFFTTAPVTVFEGFGLHNIVAQARSRSYPIDKGLGSYSQSAYNALLTQLNNAADKSADPDLTQAQFEQVKRDIAQAEAALLASINLTQGGVVYNAYRDFSADEIGKYPFGINLTALTSGATATVQEENGNKFLRLTTGAASGKANLFLPYAGNVTASANQRIVIEYRARINAGTTYFNGAMVRNDSGDNNYSMVTAFDKGQFIAQSGGTKKYLDPVSFEKWYKIKMVGNWATKKYTVYIDDVEVATDYNFRHTGGTKLTGHVLGIDGYANASIDFDDFKVMVTGVTPITSAALSPEVPNGKNGWYTHPVTVSLSVTDQLTSVAKTVYSLDDGITWQTYTVPITFIQDGTYKVTYRSADIAGNEEIAKAVSFKLDTKAPTIEVAIPGDGSIYEDSGDLTPLFTIIDNASGIDNDKTTVTLDTYSYEIGTRVPLFSLPLGTHTLVVSSVDLAGNSGSKTVIFHTVTSINSLKALVMRFAESKEIDNAGIANSLRVKLENGNLHSFVNEVQAQDGKHISNDAANYLLRGARFLLSQQ